MHAGKVVEAGDRENVFLHPRHPYTQMLISGKEEMPNRTGSMEEKPFQWIDLPKGCSFHNRCGRCIRICTLHEPPVFEFEDGHTASCWAVSSSGRGKRYEINKKCRKYPDTFFFIFLYVDAWNVLQPVPERLPVFWSRGAVF